MSIKTLTANILSKIPKIDKWQEKFIIHLFWLLISMRGRVNFEQLGRYSKYNESTFRNNFDKSFDFLSFNQKLIETVCEKEIAIAFDPSFISKSGKQTAGLGYFWSGCAGRSKKGLEIGGFGALDILNNTCMHLCAYQTILEKVEKGKEKCKSLLTYYSELVASKAEQLLKTSNKLVVDAYFSKKPFIDTVTSVGFEVISRLRNDAVLQYRYLGKRRKGRGRPRKFSGKVDRENLDEQHFKPIIKEPDFIAYEAVVFSKALKRWIKVVIVHYLKKDGTLKTAKIYFSTDLQMEGTDIFIYYKTRFQIEFLYRDGKQYTGLEQCQSRKAKRLDFHFNASLTTVSLAKAIHHLSVPFEKRRPFSMASIKTQYFNELLIDRFISAFGFSPKRIKNNPIYRKICDFGKIAA